MDALHSAEGFASTSAIRKRMQSQRERDTTPELAVRRAVWRLGLRYYVDRRPLPLLRRKADLVFPRQKVAVFVDGCFWHGCPIHGQRQHDVNGWYWPEKIAKNRERDADTDDRLRLAGWLAIRVWEHDDVDQTAAAIVEAITGRREDSPPRAGMGLV